MNTHLTTFNADLTELEGPRPRAMLFKSRKTKQTRKAKKSRVPTDYDPFKELLGVPEGYQRPEQRCWVPNSVARPVALSELSPLWRKDTATMSVAERKHRFLASVVAVVNGDFFVRRKSNGQWTIKKKAAEVKNILWNEWGAEQTALNIRIDTINTFMTEAAYIVLDGLAYVPGAGVSVEFNGRKCLNTYYEPPLAYPANAGLSDDTRLLIEMIVKNLLGETDGELYRWLDAIEDEKPSNIKWMFHYLASLYQRPGKALPVALWLIGPAQGVGKGLFTSGLQMLVGRVNAKSASAEEFKGEWTDFLTDSSLFILDEVDFSSRKEANSKLKRLIGNDIISARKRHVGEFQLPAVANFVFTTNNVRPIALDRDDRRNTFFETNGSAASKNRAKQFYQLGHDRRQSAWEGLAMILNMISIDDRVLDRAFQTDIKTRMVEAGLDPFDEWFHSENIQNAWQVNEFAPGEWIKDRYVSWAKENAYRGCATSSYAQTKVDELVSEGFISHQQRKTLHDEGKVRGYVRYDTTSNAEHPSAADCEVIKARRSSESLSNTRRKINGNQQRSRSAV